MPNLCGALKYLPQDHAFIDHAPQRDHDKSQATDMLVITIPPREDNFDAASARPRRVGFIMRSHVTGGQRRHCELFGRRRAASRPSAHLVTFPGKSAHVGRNAENFARSRSWTNL